MRAPDRALGPSRAAPTGRGGATVVPYPAHAIQHAIMCALPAPLLEMLVLSHHKGIRAKALKKATKAE